MNPHYISYAFHFLSLLVSYLILQEFKISNRKQPCKLNEIWLKNLIDKIDKVIVSDIDKSIH